ncbi:MAG: hypothetical protein Q8L93_08165 [Rhodocyclaceae bacterium]|nr:hypothetical protein [Rhodocyclaceae bacterium]
MADHAAHLIAQLLALRAVPRTHPLAQRALLDGEFRDEVERRLAAAGMRLLANPFADHLAVALTFDAEQAVFGQGKNWINNNFGLAKDGVALLVLLWALIVLPKRERQWSRQPDDQSAQQNDMFGAAKPLAAAADASRGIAEATLRADYANAAGGWTRINMNLGILSRLGFIERRNKVIFEGPLLDLAFDYEQLAPRIINGALGELLAGKTAAAEPPPVKVGADGTAPADTEALVKAAAAALNLVD